MRFELGHGGISETIRQLAKFLRERSIKALATINTHDTPAPKSLPQQDWRKVCFPQFANDPKTGFTELRMQTGAYYPTPQIRERPRYPHLPHDCDAERSVTSDIDGIGCNKFYATYGKRGMNGGILALWCRHGVCVGFHIIPKGEGRNDVFSAIFTRWEVAPRVVIYDFACALAAYCMTREPDYWKNTLFLIDKFHSSGHSTCSPACMLINYVDDDVVLATLNSSIGESGNSSLKPIKKSVSYMSEQHAIAFIKNYVSLVNCRTCLRTVLVEAAKQRDLARGPVSV